MNRFNLNIFTEDDIVSSPPEDEDSEHRHSDADSSLSTNETASQIAKRIRERDDKQKKRSKNKKDSRNKSRREEDDWVVNQESDRSGDSDSIVSKRHKSKGNKENKQILIIIFFTNTGELR